MTTESTTPDPGLDIDGLLSAIDNKTRTAASMAEDHKGDIKGERFTARAEAYAEVAQLIRDTAAGRTYVAAMEAELAEHEGRGE